jgi:hypothetical protein
MASDTFGISETSKSVQRSTIAIMISVASIVLVFMVLFVQLDIQRIQFYIREQNELPKILEESRFHSDIILDNITEIKLWNNIKDIEKAEIGIKFSCVWGSQTNQMKLVNQTCGSLLNFKPGEMNLELSNLENGEVCKIYLNFPFFDEYEVEECEGSCNFCSPYITELPNPRLRLTCNDMKNGSQILFPEKESYSMLLCNNCILSLNLESFFKGENYPNYFIEDSEKTLIFRKVEKRNPQYLRKENNKCFPIFEES